MHEAELYSGSDLDGDRDDLDTLLDEEMRDPVFRGAYEDAAARSALLQALVEQRGERRVSQGEVAARMGTTQSAVSDLERGATDPRLSTLQRYARAVGCALHLVLQAERPRGRSTWVHTPARVTAPPTVSVVAMEGFWAPLSRYVAREGRARATAFAASSATRVAPVELRAEPDEFTQAAVR
jgi:DNA-binding XRE family transcriptional regulator